MNEKNLTGAALEPKTYKVQLAKRRLTADDWVFFGSDVKTGPKRGNGVSYDLQLLFDKSPYPPLDEWVQGTMASRMVETNEMWRCVDFYRDTKELKAEDIMPRRTSEERFQRAKDRMRAAREAYIETLGN